MSIVKFPLTMALALTMFFSFQSPLAQAMTNDRSNRARAISYHIMGFIYDMHGLTPEAAQSYELSVYHDPRSYLTRLRLGSDYARLGRFQEAIDHLSIISALNPQDVQSHYLLALIYSAQKKFDKAAEEYETILKSISATSPQNTEAHFYLGQLYYSQRQYEKAITQFEKILLIDQSNVEMMYFLGSLYVEVDRNEEAIEIFKKAITIDPNHDGVLNSLGYVYAEQGINLDESIDYINRALVIDPDNAAYLDSLGWVHYKKGNYVQALKILMKAIELAQDPVIYEHIGDVYLALDQQAETKKYWRKSLDLKPGQKAILEKIDRLEKNQASNVTGQM